ncbi:MAG: hypothetical protein QXN05_02545 [Acidilobaceae archaeon]
MEENVLKLLENRELTFSEIANTLSIRDRRALRGLLADLVRRRVVERKPDYNRKKMVFSLKEAKENKKDS